MRIRGLRLLVCGLGFVAPAAAARQVEAPRPTPKPVARTVARPATATGAASCSALRAATARRPRRSATKGPTVEGITEAAFREEVDRVLKEGFTADELREARTGWLHSRQVGRSQDPQLVSQLGEYTFIGRTFAFDKAMEQKVAALTPAAITAALHRYLDPSRITIVRAGDFAKGEPETPRP